MKSSGPFNSTLSSAQPGSNGASGASGASGAHGNSTSAIATNSTALGNTGHNSTSTSTSGKGCGVTSTGDFANFTNTRHGNGTSSYGGGQNFTTGGQGDATSRSEGQYTSTIALASSIAISSVTASSATASLAAVSAASDDVTHVISTSTSVAASSTTLLSQDSTAISTGADSVSITATATSSDSCAAASATSIASSTITAAATESSTDTKTAVASSTSLATSDLAATSGSSGCTSTISSYDDVDDAVSSGCDITLEAITIPAGEALDLSGLSSGVTVTVAGDVTFTGGTEWEGPMFIIDGSDITFNGNGYTFDGQGATYWDGEGSNGGVTKPKMMKIKMSGTFSHLTVLNTPVQAFSIGSDDALTISGITIDNRDGDETDSDGDALGHNTDCFDVSASSLTLTGNTCYNQDDCLAINSGSDITFSNNYCSGGHGISIGSIKSDKTVSGVTISNNTVVSSANGLRIKTVYEATDGSVSDITYTDNTISGITEYGVVIEQDYENGSPTGTATDGIEISDISFTSGNTVSVESGADEVYVLCGSDSCTGTWDWSGLTVTGGDAGSISGDPPITGFTLA